MKTPATTLPLRHLLTAAVAIGLLCGAAHAAAASIYRCGPQGNLYSDQPCADGRLIAAADERSDEQRVQAVRVAALDRRFAAELQRERLALAATKPAAAANLGPRAAPAARAASAPKARSHARRGHSKLGQDGGVDFIAIAARAKP